MEAFDVVEDIEPGLSVSLVLASVNTLPLQHPKEALCSSIVCAATDSCSGPPKVNAEVWGISTIYGSGFPGPSAGCGQGQSGQRNGVDGRRTDSARPVFGKR